MSEESTTAAVQRYLEALAGDQPAEPIVRALLDRSVRRLQMLCANLLYRKYRRLTLPPVNLQPEEMLVEIRLEVRPDAGSAYEKVERRAGDWAIAAAGAALWMSGGVITDSGIGLTAVGGSGFRATDAETALNGKAPSEELFASAARLATEATAPATDQRGSAEYKRQLAGELTLRALRRAAARALAQEA